MKVLYAKSPYIKTESSLHATACEEKKQYLVNKFFMLNGINLLATVCKQIHSTCSLCLMRVTYLQLFVKSKTKFVEQC